ncbi:MAG: DNA-directed RNA polymerase subunit omega [Victivallales bacterium]|nr:DNA-directed RNA polymerase subunit omega [Victivallales bacterium]
MNEEYLARARAQVKDVRLFINGVSRRAEQLAKGAKQLVHPQTNEPMDWLDIALLEVAEGKVIITQGKDN